MGSLPLAAEPEFSQCEWRIECAMSHELISSLQAERPPFCSLFVISPISLAAPSLGTDPVNLAESL